MCSIADSLLFIHFSNREKRKEYRFGEQERKADDSYLRKAAIKAKVPYMTTMAAAKATAKGIHYVKTHGQGEVKSLQQLHSEIHDME